MKKSVWIFLLAVLLPSVVLGWLALRSAEEQQIVFERRTAELYQKETESLAVTVRDTVEAERRVFGETVHRLLANGDPAALARDFTNTLSDAWTVKAVGFAISQDGKLVSPSVAMAAKEPELKRFLIGNGSFLTSTEPAIVYNWGGDNLQRGKMGYAQGKQTSLNSSLLANNDGFTSKDAGQLGQQVQAGAVPSLNTKVASGNTFSGGKSGKDQAAAASPMESEMQGKGVTEASRTETVPSAAKPAPLSAPSVAPASPGAGFALAPTKPADAGMGKGRKEAKPAAAQPPGADAPISRAKAFEVAKATAKSDFAEGLTERKSAADKAPEGSTAKKMENRGIDDELRQGLAPGPAPAKFKAATQPFAPPAPAPVPQAAAVEIETGDRRRFLDETKAKAVVRAQMQEQGNDAFGSGNPGTPANVQGTTLILNNAQNRLVEPQQLLGAPSAAWSTLMPETAEFSSLTKESDDGMIARFAQDKLNLIFWLRPPEAPEMVFGCLIEADHFSDVWKDVLERHQTSQRGSYPGSDSQPEFVLALLDDRGKPVATRPASASARDWKHPFVASEIGEVLPHWEAALYLASPTALADSARGLWRTLAFTIAGAVALIAFGGWLVVADARRQLALAQQKTDFVSNVSHELKTPLTSIRMFAELMHDRPQPAEKQGQYLRIITVEAERLTRLINNVLDFAKLGRKQKRFEMKPLDLHAVVTRVWEGHEMHLRDAGFITRWEAAPGPYPVLGDDDALAQVLVNLLSNAEKYSNGQKEVELHSWFDDAHVNIAVLDRGMGVPNGDDRKIFEAFYRAHDSLASGIQGSGLGLTLAQRIAREHGGEIKFERREGGGSRFTLCLPLSGKSGAAAENII